MDARRAFQEFVTLSVIAACIALDPCVEYEMMWMENGRRSSGFNSKNTATSICDAHLNQSIWYRFEHDAGNRLIERPVEPWYCGTQAPIWLNGTHPTDAKEVTAEVCATYGSRNVCGWSETIRIRLCNGSESGFFVYQLAVPPGCPLAYCVDAASRKQCVPPFVWIQKEFRCELDETKTTAPPRVSRTCSAKPPDPGWSPWGPWSVCSKPCDYGLQSRKRKCGRLPCEGPASNNQSCNEYNCPELLEENDKGILLQLRSKSHRSDITTKIVENQEKFNTIIRNSINAICRQSASLCCGHAIENNYATATAEYVTPSDIYAAQSYPRLKSDLIGYYKIIAVINEDVVKTICSRREARQRRSQRQLLSIVSRSFVSLNLMELAIKESVLTIEKETGLLVNWNLDPTTAAVSDGNNPEHRVLCPTVTCIIPIVVCAIVIPVLAVLIGCLCNVMRHSNTKKSESESYASAYEYAVKNGQRSPSIVPFAFAEIDNSGQEESEELPETSAKKAHFGEIYF